MLKAQQSQLNASDVQAIAGCSRTKAAQIIADLGGSKDVTGRWTIDARTFYVWYNSPVRSAATGGGDTQMKIEKVISIAREVSDNGPVTFSLFKRKGKPNWLMRIYGPGKTEKVLSLGTPDKKTAQAIESEVRSRFNSLALAGVMPYDKDRYFTEWLAVKERRLAPRSYKRYCAVIEKALPFLPRELHETAPQHLERYNDWLLLQGYKPRSIILELNTLKQAFQKAVRLGYVRKNPLDDISKPAKPKPDIEPYTQDEINAVFSEFERRTQTGLREQCKEAWTAYEDVFLCLYFTGMRVSDAVSLQWKDVSLTFSTIRLTQTKTGKHAHIRIPTPFLARLKQLAQEHVGTLSGNVFVATKGTPVRYNQLDKAIRDVLRKCGFEKKSPIHSFRHTAAVRLLSAGVPIHEVAAQLGDTVETVVRNYVQPAAPAQSSIDVAYMHQFSGSRKDHESMSKTAAFAVNGAAPISVPNQQKSAKTKGFSVITEKPINPS